MDTSEGIGERYRVLITIMKRQDANAKARCERKLAAKTPTRPLPKAA